MSQKNYYGVLKEILEENLFFCLGTLGDDESWTCPLYFVYDNEYNLYFISEPSSKHVKNIIHNSHCSFSIYSTQQDPKKGARAIQGKGNCTLVDENEIDKIYSLYYARCQKGIVVNESEDIPEYYKGSQAKWKFFKVSVSQYFLFDTFTIGPNRVALNKEY